MAEKDEIVDGFRLVNLIARGNTCEVWEVTPEAGGDSLAMKLLLPNYLEDKEQITVMKTEAKVGKTMLNPNLMGCKAVVTKKDFAYILMDYFRSASLNSELSKNIISVRMRLARIVDGMCGALDFMHSKGWVHRDVKPDNILISKGGELKLIDYSLSRKFGRFAGKPSVIQGTRTYIAPETISKKAPTPQTDLYSLGATLYEVLTGRPPFRSKKPNELLMQHLKDKPVPPDEVNPNVTKEMGLLILKLLEKKPSDRPSKGAEFFAEFRSIQPFKEDVTEVQKRYEQKEKDDAQNDIDSARRLDSRADALREKENPSPRRQPPAKIVVPIVPQSPVPPNQLVTPLPTPELPDTAQPNVTPMPELPLPGTTQPNVTPMPELPLPGTTQPNVTPMPELPLPDTTQPNVTPTPELTVEQQPAPIISASKEPKPTFHPSQVGVDDKDLELMDELPDIS